MKEVEQESKESSAILLGKGSKKKKNRPSLYRLPMKTKKFSGRQAKKSEKMEKKKVKKNLEKFFFLVGKDRCIAWELGATSTESKIKKQYEHTFMLNIQYLGALVVIVAIPPPYSIRYIHVRAVLPLVAVVVTAFSTLVYRLAHRSAQNSPA